MEYRLRPGQRNFIYDGETLKRGVSYPLGHPCVKKMPERFYVYKDTPIEAQPEPEPEETIEYSPEVTESFGRLGDPEE
jgi:hypothetical protein